MLSKNLARVLARLLAALRPAGKAPAPAPQAPEMPLPPALAQRLRRIPRDEVLCRDLDRRWAELARGEIGGAVAEGLRRHVAACRRCKAVYTVLEAAVGLPLAELPGRLWFRLRAIRRQPRLPLPIRNARHAAAFSYLFAFGFVLLLGNPYDLARGAVEAWRPPIESAWEAARGRGEEMVVATAASAREGIERARRAVDARKQEVRETFDREIARLRLSIEELAAELSASEDENQPTEPEGH